METIKVIIADDEAAARNMIRNLLSKHNDFVVVAETATLSETYHKVAVLNPDLLLLDISFSDDTSFSIIKDFAALEHIPEIIFTTAYDKFAIEAIRVKAFDYLLKPVTQDDMDAALSRFMDQMKAPGNEGAMMSNMRYIEGFSHERISINTRASEYLLRPNEIVFASADGPYTDFTLLDGSTITCAQSMKSVENKFPKAMFFRISRKYLINVNYLSVINHKDRTVIISLPEKEYVLEVSKSKLPGLKIFMKTYLKGEI